MINETKYLKHWLIIAYKLERHWLVKGTSQLHTPLILPLMIKRMTIEIPCLNSQPGMENTTSQWDLNEVPPPIKKETD